MKFIRVLKASDWGYFDKFEEITDKYMPSEGEGDSMASQIVTAVNKLVYKWYNDGDVYDNVNSYMNGWANDLSSYANWLHNNVPELSSILEDIYHMNETQYEGLLKRLADTALNEELLAKYNKPKTGSIYNCDGPFEFREESEDEEEGDW